MEDKSRKKISTTNFGDYKRNEEIVAVMYGLPGRTYLIRGKVRGLKSFMGREFIVVEYKDVMLDIALFGCANILRGNEGIALWTKHHGSEKEDKSTSVDEEMNTNTNTMTKEKTPSYNSSNRYNRV